MASPEGPILSTNSVSHHDPNCWLTNKRSIKVRLLPFHVQVLTVQIYVIHKHNDSERQTEFLDSSEQNINDDECSGATDASTVNEH